MSAKHRPPGDRSGIRADVRRLAWASLFFGGCVLVIATLMLIGTYH